MRLRTSAPPKLKKGANNDHLMVHMVHEITFKTNEMTYWAHEITLRMHPME